MQFSSDQAHRASLELLAEVRDFIRRWPTHATSRDMLAKLDAHLAEPTQVLVRRASVDRQGNAHATTDDCYYRILEASLSGDNLTLRTPTGRTLTGRQVPVPDSVLLKALREGVSIVLVPEATTKRVVDNS